MERKFRKYFGVMILCFLLGGFSIIVYAIQAYSAFMGLEVYGSFREFRESQSITGMNESDINGFDMQHYNRTSGNRFMQFSPERFITSPASFILLFVGIVSIAGGISIHNLVREKEIKSTKEHLISILLTPDEKKIVDEIKRTNGNATQSQLVLKTQLSKVKVHRVINRLESKGIIKKYQYGLTNKIVLEKDI